MNLIQPPTVHPWIFGLVSGNYARYSEIKNELSVDDVLDLVEIMVVKESNINLANDSIEQR